MKHNERYITTTIGVFLSEMVAHVGARVSVSRVKKSVESSMKKKHSDRTEC